MRSGLSKFMSHEEGGTTVEFVAAMIFFSVIVFFSFEVAVAVFWNATAEKAAQIGARLAIVGDPAVPFVGCPGTVNEAGGDWPGNIGDPVPADALPRQNCRTVAGMFGSPCSEGNCQPWGPVECIGGDGCPAFGYNRVAQRMRSIFNLATDENIIIRYEDSGLGFAGGPIIPVVTVEISDVPYNLLFASLLGRMSGTGTALINMPTVSATLTGEDLSVNY